MSKLLWREGLRHPIGTDSTLMADGIGDYSAKQHGVKEESPGGVDRGGVVHSPRVERRQFRPGKEMGLAQKAYTKWYSHSKAFHLPGHQTYMRFLRLTQVISLTLIKLALLGRLGLDVG